MNLLLMSKIRKKAPEIPKTKIVGKNAYASFGG